MNTKIQHTRIDAIYASVPEQEVLTADYPLFSPEEASSFTKNSEKSVQVKTLIKLMLAVTGVYKMDPVHFH